MSDEQPSAPAEQPTAPQTTAPAPTDDAKTVPYHRFLEVVKERDNWRGQYEGVTSQAASIKDHEARIASLTAELDAERAARVEDRAFASAGLLDADAQDVARLLYGKLAEKPEGGIGAWLGSVMTDPATAPKPLQPYIGAPAKPAAPPAPRDGSAPGADQRTTGGSPTADSLRELRVQAQRTGDWTAFNAAAGITGTRR